VNHMANDQICTLDLGERQCHLSVTKVPRPSLCEQECWNEDRLTHREIRFLEGASCSAANISKISSRSVLEKIKSPPCASGPPSRTGTHTGPSFGKPQLTAASGVSTGGREAEGHRSPTLACQSSMWPVTSLWQRAAWH
jgi:hypothetical protein